MAIEHLKNEYLAKTYMNRESMTPKLEVMFTVITIFSKLRQKKSVFVASFFVLAQWESNDQKRLLEVN